jgi:tRNA 2-selenouridine synthase
MGDCGMGCICQGASDGVLYCFRGGLRSQITQQWLQPKGIAYPRVIGGYKAMRTFLLETTQFAAQECDFVVLSGSTGTGKTEVIAQLPTALIWKATPTTVAPALDNVLRVSPRRSILKISWPSTSSRSVLGHALFVLEDEGKNVGSCAVPCRCANAWRRLRWFISTMDLKRGWSAFCRTMWCGSMSLSPPVAARSAVLRPMRTNACQLGQNRAPLGRCVHQQLRQSMANALQRQEEYGDVASHRGWIAALLQHYYDPMYAYQRQSRAQRIVFEGARSEVMAYLGECGASTAAK